MSRAEGTVSEDQPMTIKVLVADDEAEVRDAYRQILVEAEASLHRYGLAGERVVARGPKVRLYDRAFSVLALVVHEMMTNAAKYGALSTAQGRLFIDWRVDEAGRCDRLIFIRDGEIIADDTPDAVRAATGTDDLEAAFLQLIRGRQEVAA